jgi:hypothetical protein
MATKRKMEKTIIASKLVNLSCALNDCGIPAEILFDDETGDPILFAALWNCQDGSAIRLEVCEDCGSCEGEILACANPIGCTYEELVEGMEEEPEEDEDEE